VEPDAARVDGAGKLTGDALAMPDAGTIRFWVKPETLPANAPTLLFASGGPASWELWADKGTLVIRRTGDGKETMRRFAGGLDAGFWQHVVVTYASTDPATWNLRVNNAPRGAAPGRMELPSTEKALCLGGSFAALFKELAVHNAVLTTGEINFVHDREQPANFNRIRVTTIPSHVWINGNRINEEVQEELVDTDKLARHLKPGVNVIGVEMAGTPRNAQGREEPGMKSAIGIWIRGRNLMEKNSPFLAGWQTIRTSRTAIGSRLLAAYDAQIKRQMDYLASQGRSAKEYRSPEWRPSSYDRPWLARKDKLNWQTVSWTPSGTGEMSPGLKPGDGLRLLRFTFILDEQGAPRPFRSLPAPE
jgi:hypothetical protein